MTRNKPLIIGLTGNSGSGKGAAGKILEEYGCLVIDCDKIAHENMAKGGIAYNDIVQAFGGEILDENGGIDRRILGGIVFADKEKLALLNSIAHKYIRQRVDELISKTSAKIVVVDAPVLKEAGMLDTVDKVWLVTADEEIRLKRVMKRDGISEEAARARFKNQTPFDETEADAVIRNNSNEDELRKEVEYHLEKLSEKKTNIPVIFAAITLFHIFVYLVLPIICHITMASWALYLGCVLFKLYFLTHAMQIIMLIIYAKKSTANRVIIKTGVILTIISFVVSFWGIILMTGMISV